MRKLSKLAAGSVIATAAAIGGASVALADGYNAPKVRYERPSDWSGVYFGVQSGYQWSSIDVSVTGTPLTASVEQNGGVVGAFLGYQHQFGSVVVGVEGDWISAFRDDFGTTTCPPGPATVQCGARLNDILTVGGRLGWAAGHWMPYVTGGYASGRFAHEVRVSGTLDNSASTRNDGWYIGGGAEWKVSPGWTAGLEYRHYEFDKATDLAVTPTGAPVNNRTIDPTSDTITARVSWRWGRETLTPLK